MNTLYIPLQQISRCLYCLDPSLVLYKTDKSQHPLQPPAKDVAYSFTLMQVDLQYHYHVGGSAIFLSSETSASVSVASPAFVFSEFAYFTASFHHPTSTFSESTTFATTALFSVSKNSQDNSHFLVYPFFIIFETHQGPTSTKDSKCSTAADLF